MKTNVPFYTQCWDLDAWQDSGYASRKDAEYWQRSSCGILCAKMVMNGLREGSVQDTIKELIDVGVAKEAYSDASGWSHDGLVELIQSFSFEAQRGSFSTEVLRETLTSGALPIVSIKWAFQNTKTFKERILFWKKYGGHLAVLVGFEEDSGRLTGFYVHHTSKIPEQNWESRFVPLHTFLKGYTGRGILVWQK
ncbi:C39 family peptidase [Candidatus Uhrbacteria bacterium]|nr:C39 family peptidase [Candidatus Uhrbacteria bacterium]